MIKLGNILYDDDLIPIKIETNGVVTKISDEEIKKFISEREANINRELLISQKIRDIAIAELKKEGKIK